MDPDKNRPETEVDAGSEKDNLEPTKGVKSKKKKGDNGDQDKDSERKNKGSLLKKTEKGRVDGSQYIELEPTISEARKDTAVIAFGRMNPPTVGHEKLVNKVKSFNGDHYIFLSQTQKPKDNPLPFDVKLEFAKQFFPGVNVGHPTVRTPIQMLQMLEKLGYTDVIYVAGSDRVASFDKLFNDYNGKEYNFDSITVVNAGERDPDADGAEGMSASKMRQAAADNDLESFKQGVPQQELADEMFAAVKQGMGIRDKEPEMAEGWFGFGEGDPIEAPEWLNDENKALWATTQPTTKDKRLVTQLEKLQRFIQAGLTDQANQVVARELSMMQREDINNGH